MIARIPALAVALVLVLAFGLAACSPSTPSPAGTVAPPSESDAVVDAATIGRQFVESLASGDTAAAEALEDQTMRAAAPAEALGQLWGQIEGQFGPFERIAGVETAEQAPFVVATVSTEFADATVPLLVTVDGQGRVAGFHLGQPEPGASPAGSPASAEAVPDYVDAEAFTEREVTVGESPWELPGTLSMPVGDGPFPAVVLVAGSGPNDRDETIGPNKPLREIAWGLASNGIAVVRYDKRGKVHAPAMAADAASVTVAEEVVDDAVAAVELLHDTPGVDPERVFVVGHSLGGYLAPRIASEATGQVAGIGILAGSTSPIQDLIVQQYEYLASPDGGADPQAAAALGQIREQVGRVNSADLTPSTPATDLPLGIPAAYWLDLRGYDPAATAAALAIPVLIAQGGRDYQVPPSELDGWREALVGRDDVAIHEYPAINHLLMEGSGPSRPAEYAVPGHVAGDLVRDLAAWVVSAS